MDEPISKDDDENGVEEAINMLLEKTEKLEKELEDLIRRFDKDG